jgi:hypothetical protein
LPSHSAPGVTLNEEVPKIERGEEEMSKYQHDAAVRSTVVTKRAKWPLERLLFALAGSVTLLSTLLAVLVSPWFLLLTAFAGVNQWLYVTARACPVSMVLKRFGFDPQCRW